MNMQMPFNSLLDMKLSGSPMVRYLARGQVPDVESYFLVHSQLDVGSME
jgi:hypothetical protein